MVFRSCFIAGNPYGDGEVTCFFFFFLSFFSFLFPTLSSSGSTVRIWWETAHARLGQRSAEVWWYLQFFAHLVSLPHCHPASQNRRKGQCIHSVSSLISWWIRLGESCQRTRFCVQGGLSVPTFLSFFLFSPRISVHFFAFACSLVPLDPWCFPLRKRITSLPSCRSMTSTAPARGCRLSVAPQKVRKTNRPFQWPKRGWGLSLSQWIEKIVIFCKGADNIIFERLAKTSEEAYLQTLTSQALEVFSFFPHLLFAPVPMIIPPL